MRQVAACVLVIGWAKTGRTAENTRPDTGAVASAIIPKLR